MPGVNLTEDFVNGAIMAIVAFLVIRQLSQIIRGIMAFFKPQTAIHKTAKSPFQVFVSFLTNLAILAIIAYAVMQILRLYNSRQ